MSVYIKTWGLLKYYHPAVTSGKYDWDSVFVHKFPELEKVQTKQDLNAFLDRWITSLGDVTKNKIHKIEYDKTFEANKNFLAWINSSLLLDSTTKQSLWLIVEHRQLNKSHYVRLTKKKVAEFTNEKDHEKNSFPLKQQRFLILARVWNMIEYFYPYKHILDNRWDFALDESIEWFFKAGNKEQHFYAIARLIGMIDDNHPSLLNPYGLRLFGKEYKLPVITAFVRDSLTIVSNVNNSMAIKDDWKLGDIILSVNGIPVHEIIQKYLPYFPHARYETFLRDIKYATGFSDSIAKVGFIRDGIPMEKSVSLYSPFELTGMKAEDDLPISDHLINGSIAYLHMGNLPYRQTKQILKKYKDTKALIFDLRHYPQYDYLYPICDFLGTKRQAFAKEAYPDIELPGTFIFDDIHYCGKNRNKSRYKGKIIILINEETQSMGEFTTMALMTLPNAVVIGTNSTGTDGVVSFLKIPFGYGNVMISGKATYFPDGTPTQRTGIKPAIIQNRSAAGISHHKDELLERALKYAVDGE